MKSGVWWSVIGALFFVIIVLAVALFAIPAPVHAPTTPAATPNGSQALHDRVLVSSPQPGAAVGKTFAVKGEAPGNWYFEASFPIQVRDRDGKLLGQAVAQAQSDWMTTAQVPFEATVALDVSYTGPATLFLRRDNPSGLPENDDSLEFAIIIR